MGAANQLLLPNGNDNSLRQGAHPAQLMEHQAMPDAAAGYGQQ